MFHKVTLEEHDMHECNRSGMKLQLFKLHPHLRCSYKTFFDFGIVEAEAVDWKAVQPRR